MNIERAGHLTPTFCVTAKLSFGAFLDYALQLGADLIATGHYAAD